MQFITENNQVGISDPDLFQQNVQGLVNLHDNLEEDGGFQIIPGFHRHLVEWAKNTPHLKRQYGNRATFIVIPENEPIQKLSIRVTARAGSAVLWDQRTVHGSRPNNSSNPRYAQFFKMFPALPLESERAKFRALKIKEKIEEVKFQPSELGKNLFGLEPYINS